MSRSVNHSIAWVSAVFLSLCVFGVGYGFFTYIAHDDHGTDDAVSGHGDHEKHGKDEGHEKAKKEDEHGRAAAEKENHGAPDAHAPADHGEESHGGTHEEKEAPKDVEHGASKNHGADAHKSDKDSHGEEEISADQFKKKSDEHH